MVHCHTEQKDNLAVVRLDGYKDIIFDFLSEPAFEITNADFALWGILPIAMRHKLSIDFQQPISIESLKSAQQVAGIWAQWLPGFYHVPKINASIAPPVAHSNKKNLTFFSGGVDSTFSSYKAFKVGGEDSDCLTVQGLDYSPGSSGGEKFEKLKKLTESFRDLVFDRSRFIRTNLYNVYNKASYGGCNPRGHHVTHIFALFSCASLFNEYSNYHISADHRLDQQYMTHPWGSNSATNRLMRNGNGVLKTLDDDYLRVEKIKFLSDSDLELSSLSICANRRFRPNNCGVCKWCMRAKIMFYASNETIPDIFADQEINDNWHKHIPFKSNNDRMHCSDLLSFVRSRGLEKTFPGFAEAEAKLTNSLEKPQS